MAALGPVQPVASVSEPEPTTAGASTARLELTLPAASPSLAAPEPESQTSVAVAASYHESTHTVELSSTEMRLALTHSPSTIAQLTAWTIDGGMPLIQNVSASLMLEDGRSLDISTAARPAGQVALEPVEERGLGAGVRVQAPVWIEALALVAQVEITLFEDAPCFAYRLVLPPGDHPITAISYRAESIPLGRGEVTYLTDDAVVLQGVVPPEGTEVPIGHGKPLLLRGDSRALLMAALDPSDAPSSLWAKASAEGVAFQWRQRYSRADHGEGGSYPPRLLLRMVDDGDLARTFAPYRSLMQALYPPAPLPPWFRQQWISWYLYGMDIDEQKLISQIDYIAANLNDLGPWSILIDAGWYVAEGRPDSHWRNVDSAKFPSGLRSLVDYAHQRGIRIVLYFSASYLDDKVDQGNWLGLKGIVEQHPDWLARIDSGDPWATYHYDYGDPGFRDYLKTVLHDYFVQYGVDGIKVDGLLDSRLAVQRGIERGLYTPGDAPILPVTSVYAFIHREVVALRPDAYVEAGWRMPAFSAPHYSVARQSDDWHSFDAPWPAPGLRGHVDYAIAQLLMMGQRPHLGNYWGDPEDNPVGLQWLEAGLALDAPVVLGFDLTAMSTEALSRYRSRLSQLRPFAGQLHLPAVLNPESFSAVSGGTTFLALLNREGEPREMRAELADHGLPADTDLALYDVAWGAPLAARGAVSARVDPHTLRLFVLRSEPGVLWTNSGFSATDFENGLILKMSGPEELRGYAYLTTPEPRAALLNGRPLPRDSWSYDQETGVMRVEYPHTPNGVATLEIRH